MAKRRVIKNATIANKSLKQTLKAERFLEVLTFIKGFNCMKRLNFALALLKLGWALKRKDLYKWRDPLRIRVTFPWSSIPSRGKSGPTLRNYSA